VNQIAGNLDAVDGFLTGKRYLIHDRDRLYTKEFLSIVASCGIETVKLPPRSPNRMPKRNALFARLKKVVWTFFGEDSLPNDKGDNAFEQVPLLERISVNAAVVEELGGREGNELLPQNYRIKRRSAAKP
jgi:hypothetical protein